LGARELAAVELLLSGRLARRSVALDVLEHFAAGAGVASVAGYGAVTMAPQEPVAAAGLAAVALLGLVGYRRYTSHHGVDEGRGAPLGAVRLAGFDVTEHGATGTAARPVPSRADAAREPIATELWACRAAGGARDLVERRSYTTGFVIHLGDGRSVDVPAGRVRLEDLVRRRTEILHHDAMTRLIRLSLFAGDRVELVSPIRPRDGAWSYRAATICGFDVLGVARLRIVSG
jgi:hypothetical protein